MLLTIEHALEGMPHLGQYGAFAINTVKCKEILLPLALLLVLANAPQPHFRPGAFVNTWLWDVHWDWWYSQRLENIHNTLVLFYTENSHECPHSHLELAETQRLRVFTQIGVFTNAHSHTLDWGHSQRMGVFGSISKVSVTCILQE